MSSEATQRSIQGVQREIEQLQRKLADVSRDEARQSETLSRLVAELSRITNASSRSGKEQSVRTCQQTICRLQAKRADLTRRVADRTVELHRWQQRLYQEQAREHKDALAAVRTLTDGARSRQDHLVHGLSIAPTPSGTHVTYDAFISHATEDKDDFVRPLAEKLRAAGFNIWYDEFQLAVGDSLRRSIDRGLASSRFGIVVLSPSFFAKNWPQYELDGLVARESAGGKIILPLWHKVSKDQVLSYSPSLVDKVALNSAISTLDEIVVALASVLRSQ